MRYVYPPEPWRRRALPVLRSPAGRDVGECEMLGENMPAIASLEDLKAVQKDLCYSMKVCLKRSDPQVKRSSSDSDP